MTLDYRSLVDGIRSTTDKERKAELKKKLPAITPSGIFSKRNQRCLISHSGIIAIDIDGKDNPNSNPEEIKEKLSKLPYVFYAGLSVSGNGIVCYIQISDSEKHLQHFQAIQKDFLKLGIVIDKACSDKTRLRFYSQDSNPYTNQYAAIYESLSEEKIVHKNISKPYVPKDVQKIIPNEKPKEINPEDFADMFMMSTLDDGDVTPVLTQSKSGLIKKVAETVIEQKVDITERYEDWMNICIIFKMLYGESGRELFHRISAFYPNYSYDETDKFYSGFSGYIKSSDEFLRIARRYKLY